MVGWDWIDIIDFVNCRTGYKLYSLNSVDKLEMIYESPCRDVTIVERLFSSSLIGQQQRFGLGVFCGRRSRSRHLRVSTAPEDVFFKTLDNISEIILKTVF